MATVKQLKDKLAAYPEWAEVFLFDEEFADWKPLRQVEEIIEDDELKGVGIS